MALLDIFHKKETEEVVENFIVKADDSFIGTAEKAADMVSQTIRDGKFESVTKKLSEISKKNENRERFVFEAPSISRWIIALLLGITFSAGYFYFFIVAGGMIAYSDDYRIYGMYVLLTVIIVVLINILIIRKAIKEIRFSRRYDHYQNILRYRSIEIVDDLVAMIDVNRSVVEKDLFKAIKNNLIPQGHFGRNNVIFMVSDVVFEEYLKRRAVYDRYFNKLIEERNRMKDRTPETEELLEQGQEYIIKIRDSNDVIKDKEISKKLERMEKVVSAIFHEVDVNPSQANKLGVFMGYYLPTTEKLLEAYMELDEKQVKGKNTDKTKNDISNALDSINSAFEGLLERFYQEQERDVTSEIFAMEEIMKQEGLQSDE